MLSVDCQCLCVASVNMFGSERSVVTGRRMWENHRSVGATGMAKLCCGLLAVSVAGHPRSCDGSSMWW